MPDPKLDDLKLVMWAGLLEEAPEELLTPAGAPTQPAQPPASGCGHFPVLHKKAKKLSEAKLRNIYTIL